MSELHEAHVKEHEIYLEEEKKEKEKFLGQIKRFEEELVPMIRDFFSSEDDNVFVQIQGLLKDLKFLDSESYLKLSKNELDPQFMHDLTNFASPTNGFRRLLIENSEYTLEKKKKILNFFYENSLPYSMVMEDLLSRDEDGDIRDDVERRAMDFESVSTCLGVLSESRGMKGLIKEKFKFKDIDASSLLQEDEEVITVPGDIVNSLMNMVRNSCTERTVASSAEVDIKRDGGHIVFRVIDNGKGMARQHLEKGYAETGYVFDKGRQSSGSNSTGLGLADMDKRITSLGGILRVASKRKLSKEKNGGQVNFTTETGEEKLPDIELGEGQSTIFEIRLPITKKK